MKDIGFPIGNPGMNAGDIADSLPKVDDAIKLMDRQKRPAPIGDYAKLSPDVPDQMGHSVLGAPG
jgi:hypothetical protein